MYRHVLDLDLKLVAEGLRLPEGPALLPDGSLLVVEIEGQTLVRISPSGEVAKVADVPGGPNGIAVRGEYAYLCNNGGAFTYRKVNGLNTVVPVAATHTTGSLQKIDLRSGRIHTLATEAGGRRLESPNDLVFDAHGGIWLTDFGCTTALGRNYGSICYWPGDGAPVRRVREGIVSPNGIGLSADGRVLYVADTVLGRLWSFEVTGPGELGAPPAHQVGAVVSNLPGSQRLDSLAVEAGGEICVATIGDGGISVFHPEGSWVDLYRVPDRFVTNLCFGGADMRDVWITASGTGRVYKTRWPRPGLKLNDRS